ncbi:MAG: Uma2 family endonuclease [Rhodopirellula sp.]|nr:Uma2 family endonuclease [Rhodopirellula sp.]
MSVIPFTSVYYPESDGKPTGETDLHREEMFRLIHSLQRFYAGGKVYVSGNLLLYYEQGNPKKFVVPDVFVVNQIEPHPRRVYKVWVERKVPDVIIEVTSRKTKKTDATKKPDLYRQLRVPEYYLFDPTQDYLDPPLQGYRAAGEQYEPVAPDPQGSLVSEQLAMRLEVRDQHLVLCRLDTGERLLTDEEAWQRSEEARRVAEAGREAEAEARRAAEAELARLREELRRSRS